MVLIWKRFSEISQKGRAEGMRTVFIFGAGASRVAGGPLMSDFLDMAESIYRSRSNAWPKETKEHFEEALNARAELRTIHEKLIWIWIISKVSWVQLKWGDW